MGSTSCHGKRLLIHLGHPVTIYRLLRNSLGELPPTCFPAPHVASGSVGETSGGVVYVREDFVEDMLWLLCLFLELARLTTV